MIDQVAQNMMALISTSVASPEALAVVVDAHEREVSARYHELHEHSNMFLAFRMIFPIFVQGLAAAIEV